MAQQPPRRALPPAAMAGRGQRPWTAFRVDVFMQAADAARREAAYLAGAMGAADGYHTVMPATPGEIVLPARGT
eukprot:4606673-Lingulodinium_polyedra.AAC.1